MISRIFKMASAPSDEGLAIKLSIGVALSEPGQTGNELHELADLALYRTKADGRNTARIYNKHFTDEESRRALLERDLEKVVFATEFRLASQPIANAVSLKIVAYGRALPSDVRSRS